jgi:hypothetical protein
MSIGKSHESLSLLSRIVSAPRCFYGRAQALQAHFKAIFGPRSASRDQREGCVSLDSAIAKAIG